MKLMAYFPLMLALAVAAQAQTNDPSLNTSALTNVTQSLTNLPAKPIRLMSLQDCVEETLKHNLDVQFVRYEPQKARYDLRAAYGGYDPVLGAKFEKARNRTRGDLDTNGIVGPSATINSETVTSGLIGTTPWGMTYDLALELSERYGNSGGNNFDGTEGFVSGKLTQPLLRNLWIDETRLGIALAKRNVKISDHQLRFQLMESIREVEDAYYDLIAAHENVKVQTKGLELAERLLTENKKRVEVGALAPLDEKQAEAQVSTARADLLSARQEVAARENILKSRLTDNYRELHEVEIRPAEGLSTPVKTFNIMDSWSKGMTLRPELQQAKLAAESQGIQLKYDKNQVFPQLDVFGTYGYGAGGVGTVTYGDGFSDFRRGDQPFYSYGAQFSVPLSSQATRNNYKSSKASLQQLTVDVKRWEQRVMVEIDDALIAAKASYERVDATRAARVYAEAALDAEQKKLESGKSTSFFVLQLQRDLTDAHSNEIAALADYNKALAALARAEGSTLEHRNIDLRK